MPASEAQRSGPGSTDTAVARDAMCTRIRKLGNDILAITRAAVQRVEELDAEYAQEIERKQQRQQMTRLSPRPSVNVKANRSSKSVPQGLASRAQPRPSLPARPGLGRRSVTGVSSAPPPDAGSAAVNGAGSPVKGPAAVPAGAAGKKKRRSRAPPTPVLKAAPAANDRASSAPAPPPPPEPQQDSAGGLSNGAAAATTHGEAPKNASNGGAAPLLNSPQVMKGASNSRHVDDDKSDASERAVGVDVLQAADDSYQRLLANSPTRLGRSDEGLYHATLYDLSNAASVDNSASANRKGAVNTAAAPATVAAAADGHVAYAEGVSRGIGHSPIDRPYVESFELPESTPYELAAVSPTGADGAPHSASYYCVVYIHQSLRARVGSSRGSGYSSSRSGALRRRLTPQLVSPASVSPCATDKEEEEEPRMINSYVSAMYAVADNDGEAGGRQRSGREAQHSLASETNPLAAAAAAGTAAGRCSANLAPVIQIELRLPTHRSISSVNASPVSTPLSTAFRFPPAGELASEKAEAGDGQRGSPGRAGHSRSPADATTATTAGDATGTNNNEEEVVAAQIETMEGWRRDRRTSVEQRIRKRRTSTFVSQGWRGEYYYYAPSASRAPVGHVLSPSTPGAGAAAATSEGLSNSRGVSPSSNHTDPLFGGATRARPVAGDVDDDLHSTPLQQPPLHPCKTNRFDESRSPVLYATSAGDMAVTGTPGSYATPLRPPFPLSPLSPSDSRRSVTRAGSPSAVGAAGAAATTTTPATAYNVLFRTRSSSASTSTSSMPRSPREGTAPGGEQDDVVAAVAGGGDDAKEDQDARRKYSSPTRASDAAAGDAMTSPSSSSRKWSAPLQQQQQRRRPGSGSAGASRRRRYPRMEVVIASDYNAMEWAFAGAARRISAMSEEVVEEEEEEPAVAEKSAAFAHNAAAATAAPSTPLWTAYQRRELAEEEHRGWDAPTRQPHSADIHAPIVLKLSM
ncbi:hypothetical protein ABB37_09055 [Leptomonas pyrrhocoris]|uniref:Uncharacterized protein n=1 Tax=Leptomonas pyrrhocoris TaxID=157538 RepID=A0A0M9FS60_LEPPY|nr:hypothetical protein ABB37_09055 [Leptomonas pyrrhocoris]KPA74766.1 hypothetical protein ABB37_09055 [Leptomonas pyrrhocoris]|eukprot:XP_015653205.1 hypothetical protein ABB37_09055 [Leptomonas pyrrhocoris]